MRFNFIFLSCLLLLLSEAATQQFDGCSGKVNENPIQNVQLQVQMTTQNGSKLFWKNDTSYITVVNVTGSPSEIGEAIGLLLTTEINENVQNMFRYFEDQIEEYLESIKIPKFLAESLGVVGIGTLKFLLDMNWWVAYPYIPKRYEQEMRGIAKTSKVDYLDLRRINMLPELTKASCTIVGAWDDSTIDDKLLQLRALDWDYQAPVSKNPAIIIYHSNEQGSYPFANIGYAGLVGTFTALSSQGIAISEKVWIPNPSNSTIKTTYFGKPWMFVLRDVAQFTNSLETAVQNMRDSKKTCKIMLGIGSAIDKSFVGVEYSKNILAVFNDKNYTDYSESHPQMNGVFFWDKHPQPSSNPCVGNILENYWGNIVMETLWRDVCGLSQTGDTQVCVFDIYENIIYLQYSEYGSDTKAYDRSIMMIDLKEFW